MPTEHNGWKLELSVIPLATKHQTSSETTKRLVIYGFLGFSIFFVAIMNYMLIVIATLGRRAKSVGVHKCNGANNGNIFSMFMMETGIIVLVSILVCAFIIFNARDLIEDLLSVRLASLFTWGTLWVPLLVVVLLFLLAGVLPGRIFSHIPVTQVFRRYTDGKKGWKRSLLFIQFTGVSFVHEFIQALQIFIVGFFQPYIEGMIKRITTYQHNGLLRLIETLIAHITEHTYYSSFLNLIKRFSYGSIRPFLKPDYLFIHQQIFGMGHRLSFYNRNAYHIRIIKINIVHIKNTYTLAVTAHQSFCYSYAR